VWQLRCVSIWLLSAQQCVAFFLDSAQKWLKTERPEFMAALKQNSLILYVDDHRDKLDRWRMLLENEGYRVLTAADADAMQLFISQPVDEVILDYQMPGITGDVMAREMKTLKPDVPILMLSGGRRLSEEQLNSVDAFLLKPDSISVFLEQVRTLLARRAMNESSVSSGFFSRWLDDWKSRVSTRQLEDKA
jgi:DNA-binding response OmpR family regulator